MSCSAPLRTCRRSRPRASLPMSAPTSGRSASVCSRLSPGDACSAAPTRRGCWPRCSRTSPTSRRCLLRRRRRCGDCYGAASRRIASGDLHDIADARLELEEAITAPAAEPDPIAAPARGARTRWIAIGVAAAFGLGAAAEPAGRRVAAAGARAGAARSLRPRGATQGRGATPHDPTTWRSPATRASWSTAPACHRRRRRRYELGVSTSSRERRSEASSLARTGRFFRRTTDGSAISTLLGPCARSRYSAAPA